MPPGMYGMAPGSQFGAPYGQQGGHPMLGAQVTVPAYAIEPYGAPAPNIRYQNPASMPLGYPPQPPQAPEGQGPQGMAGYGPQGVPAAAYDQQAMLGYGTYGQGGPQAPYLYGPPVTAPYPQPGFASGQEYAGIPPGYAPPPGYGAAAPPGYPTDQAAGMPSEREPQQFDPCTGRDVCTCPAQHKIGEYCVQSNLGMDAIQRFLKSLQLSCPANGLQNCALLLPIDLDMANRTDEGDTKKGKKSSPKRRLSTGDAAGKKAASLDATKSKGSVRSSPVASPDAISPVTSNSNDPNAATECTPVAAACPPPQPSMRSFTCNTSCQVQADDSTQTVGGTSKKNPKEYPTAYQCEPAKGPSCCNACCNGCCQSCYWPYYYYYNPYTGCYYWYPNYCNGCQNCCPKDPLEKIPEKPQPKEPAAAAGATAAATPKAKKKNDRKMGGGPAGMSYSLSCAIPKRRTTAAAATRNMRQAIMPGYYPTSMPSDCSPYGQIGLARGRIP
ncbi:uncharacterized protein LOC111071175 [Drosophila obscura]|uniref:uncharacterized protein LOC111071175 n=1 Tax=Drosophila obscura TaxID=7282 RepID=UPI001BB1DC24|nr:uncharacterized protein LOC111071175 [Drosophila obscura]